MEKYDPSWSEEKKTAWRKEMASFSLNDITQKESDANQLSSLKRKRELAQKREETKSREEFEQGQIRDVRVVSPEDLKPNAFKNTPEDVSANPGDDDERFEKRRYDLEGRK